MRCRTLLPGCLSCVLAIVAGATEPEAFRQELETAVSHGGAGRFTDALASYGRALEMADGTGIAVWRARVLRERGVTYMHQGALEDARADLDESVSIFDREGDLAGASQARLRIVSILSSSSPAEAQELLGRIERDLRLAGDQKTLRYAELYQARLQVNEGRYEESLQRLATLRTHYSEKQDNGRVADVLSLESYALQQLGRLEESGQSYSDLIDAAFASHNQQLVAYAYCNLGDVRRELGAYTAAEENLDRAIELLDRMRAEVSGGVEERMTYLDAQVSAYDGKIRLLVDKGDHVGALEVAERFHARSLLEELRSPDRPTDRAEPSGEDRAILDKLIELQHRLVRDGLSDEEALKLRDLELRWDQAGRALRRRRAPAASPVTPRSLEDVQRKLPKATAMLVYWIHPERSWLWLMMPDRIELIQIPIGREALRSAVARYLEPIRDRVRAEDMALRGENREHLEQGVELYRLLIEPARSRLESIDHLIVVPDDHLWHLPFEALVQEIGEQSEAAPETWFAEYAHARFLLEDFSLLYAHSASVWAELAGRPIGGEGLVAMAPSLDGSEVAGERGWLLAALPRAQQEAASIASVIRPGLALVGRDATERRIKETAGRYRFLHFATHGYLHRERPDLSGVFLWPMEQTSAARSLEDGLFQGFEVRQLPLRAELVSVAACNSGMGQLSRAEGIVGLARAFLTAGSRNVLVSLWPVDDQASGVLIESFYRELQTSVPLPEALKRAKHRLFRETTLDTVVDRDERVAYAHPYFWATYVLIGGDAMQRP